MRQRMVKASRLFLDIQGAPGLGRGRLFLLRGELDKAWRRGVGGHDYSRDRGRRS